MKRRPGCAVFLILLVIYSGVWWFLPSREVPVVIVDKTVPTPEMREHALVSWLFAHYRVTTDGVLPSAERYVGTYSDTKWKRLESGDLVGKKMLYLADGYGIYHMEGTFRQYEESLAREIPMIDLVYGGYNSEEVSLVESFISRGGVCVAEFNLFGSPTNETTEGERLERIFGVKYTGWLGRGYGDLSQVPKWMRVVYEEYAGDKWTFSGPGLVIFREDVPKRKWRPEILVLTKDDIEWPWLELQSPGTGITTGASREVGYDYWFEINTALDDTEVAAWFDIGANSRTAAMLEKRGLSSRFPAVVTRRSGGKSLSTVYFCGDFADQAFGGAFHWVWLSHWWYRALSYVPGFPAGSKFAWRWYAPVMKNIIDETSLGR
jgi:hypothetical protein